jgi:hypothetical protein
MNVFGEASTYTPAGGTAFAITGVFDEQYTDVMVADGQPITSTMPVLGVQLSQFTNPPQQGDTLIITRTAETFVVKEVRPDGHGWAKLMLNLA